MLGRLPPFLHVQHGGILHAIVEHLPPESKWCPWWHHLLIPVWLWLLVPLPRSLGLPSHLLPRLRIPTGMAGGHPGSVCCCPGFPCPQVCLGGTQVLCAGWLPQWACHTPLPSHAPLLSHGTTALRLVSLLSLLSSQSAFISFNTTGFLFVKFS